MSKNKKSNNKNKAVKTEPTGFAKLAEMDKSTLKEAPTVLKQDNVSLGGDQPSAGYSAAWAYPEINVPEAPEDPNAPNPNPFDFVPFPEGGPSLFDKSELDKEGDLYSGYLDVTLKSLTPVHIAGKQEPFDRKAGLKIKNSHFYREGGEPCIPGSSIKGMLRSFIEALTNGWVSQAQEKDTTYKKAEKGRHIGFYSFKVETNQHHSGSFAPNHDSIIQPAVPHGYKPSSGDELDIASYMFGYVMDDDKGETLKSRVMIEDAYFDEGKLKEDCKMPDIDGTAFMGGPHPSASNWWYMRPRYVWRRSPRKPNRPDERLQPVAEFVGEGYWGRKFYYHQEPQPCLKWYIAQWALLHRTTLKDSTPVRLNNKIKNKGKREVSRENNGNMVEAVVEPPLYTYNVEMLDKEKSVSFKLYINRLPEKLLKLLLLCLCPGDTIRHKLGYGRAYGYGSVKLEIKGVKLRKEKAADWPDDLGYTEEMEAMIKNLMKDNWLSEDVQKFIHPSSLPTLAQILGWVPDDNITFTYPPFNRGNFTTPVNWERGFEPSWPQGVPKTQVTGKPFAITLQKALPVIIAGNLWSKKKTIHLPLYQARAKGYSKIKERRP